MSWILVFVLAIALAGVVGKQIILKKEITQMAHTVLRIHEEESAQRIKVGSQDRAVLALANAVNSLYEDAAAERVAHSLAMREIRQGMANVSHDLRTPLTSIVGYLKLLQNGGNSPEQTQHYVEVAYKKALSMNELVVGLFQLARLESGAHGFELQRLDVNELLEEQLAGFYEGLSATGGEPKVELAQQPLWMIGDAAALSRTFANLLQNMVQHQAQEIVIRSLLAPEGVVLQFSNRAPGLTAEDTAQLFQRFFVGDRMRTGQSTGLGLSIAKELVEGMGGSITAQLQHEVLTFTLLFASAGGA